MALARAVQRHGKGSREEYEARQAHAEAKISDYIKKVVDAAPPLTAEQRDRIALALKGGRA
jgi:hypothetical protein